MTELVHGKYSTYSNRRCRCDACREAWRVYWLRHRRRRGVRPLALVTAEVKARAAQRHGVRGRYVKGCRCDECRAAEAAYRAEYRARQRVTR